MPVGLFTTRLVLLLLLCRSFCRSPPSHVARPLSSSLCPDPKATVTVLYGSTYACSFAVARMPPHPLRKRAAVLAKLATAPGCGPAEAVLVAQGYLAAHPGDGELGAAIDAVRAEFRAAEGRRGA